METINVYLKTNMIIPSTEDFCCCMCCCACKIIEECCNFMEKMVCSIVYKRDTHIAYI